MPRYPARSGSVPGAGVHRSAGGRGDAPGEMQGTSLPAAGPGRALLASLATDSHLPGGGGEGLQRVYRKPHHVQRCCILNARGS